MVCLERRSDGFRDDPLEYVFKRVGQAFNVEIVVMDKEIANQPYRSSLQTGVARDSTLTPTIGTHPICEL